MRPLSELEAQAPVLPLNSMGSAEQIFYYLEDASPIADPMGRDVWVTSRLLCHMWEKVDDQQTYTQRMQRMIWVEPTIQQPSEIHENKDGRPGRVYLACYKGYKPSDPGRCQFFTVIVKNKVWRAEDGVVTMYPFRRAKDVETMRRAKQLWP